MGIAANMSYDQLMRMQASGRVYQERYDDALQPWDQRAPPPVLGQDLDAYRRDTLVKIKRLLPDGHELRKVQIRKMPDDALNVFEPQILKAARAEAYNPNTVPRGEFRRVTEVDSNGLKIVKYIGQESFVRALTRPGRRVTSFRTDQGFIDASGRPLR
jgi:hypothetical protein